MNSWEQTTRNNTGERDKNTHREKTREKTPASCNLNKLEITAIKDVSANKNIFIQKRIKAIGLRK